MPYKIIAEECTNCAACETECPNDAILEKKGTFIILADKCTECVGHYDDAQCVEVCPIPDCVVIDESLPRYAA
jgi:ferredoxin